VAVVAWCCGGAGTTHSEMKVNDGQAGREAGRQASRQASRQAGRQAHAATLTREHARVLSTQAREPSDKRTHRRVAQQDDVSHAHQQRDDTNGEGVGEQAFADVGAREALHTACNRVRDGRRHNEEEHADLADLVDQTRHGVPHVLGQVGGLGTQVVGRDRRGSRSGQGMGCTGEGGMMTSRVMGVTCVTCATVYQSLRCHWQACGVLTTPNESDSCTDAKGPTCTHLWRSRQPSIRTPGWGWHPPGNPRTRTWSGDEVWKALNPNLPVLLSDSCRRT
jgi:hypothetical protein